MRAKHNGRMEAVRWNKPGKAGIGTGWEGQAWIALQQARAGLRPFDARLSRAFASHAKLAIQRGPSESCGVWEGSGAPALVLLLAAEYDPTLRPLARAAIIQWKGSSKRSPNYDVMSGRAGALLACAELEAVREGLAPVDFARQLHVECTQRLSILLDIAADSPIYLGLSHGIAGFLLALESGQTSFGFTTKKALLARTRDMLYENCVEGRKGAIYSRKSNHDQHVSMHGWCHGAPGLALALIVCARLTGKVEYRSFADGALRATFDFQNDLLSFCCGMAGRAHILLEAYRLNPKANKSWLAKARTLHTRLSTAPRPGDLKRTGFLKGQSAIDYLDQRLADPHHLPMPGLGAFSGRTP